MSGRWAAGRWAAAGLLLLLAAAVAYGQESAQPPAANAQQQQPSASEAPKQENQPEEYRPEEFPQFLHDLRRGEIIMVGSFPFSLFFTLEVYDMYRYFANDRRSEYAPWPFRQPGATPYTVQENLGVLGAAIGVSLLVAVADYIIGRLGERDRR